MRALSLMVAMALLGAPPAAGSTGVSIDLARIDVSQTLDRGGRYDLPTFGVRNPGTEKTSYTLEVSYIDGQRGRRPSASWFEFLPAKLTLRAGESRAVVTRLKIPTGTEPGDYSALIGPRIVTGKKGAQVGAAAAARLTFTVEPSSGLAAWWRWLRGLDPLVWTVPGVLLGAVGVARFGSRFRISVARRA
jgi:hypothetical protein